MSHSNPELHGEIVSWDTKSSELSIASIRDALSDAGLPDDVAKDLNNRSAFSRAAKHLKENRSIDKVKDTKDNKIIFQLTRKEVIDDKVDFNYETQVTLDTSSGDITSDDPVIEKQARELFAHAMQVRTASDVTRMVQSLFKNNADLFPINPTKGVAYFVPSKFSEFTAKVEKFLSTVGGNVCRFPVPKGTAEGNRSVMEAVSSGMQTLLDELEESIDSWDDTTRQDTMKRGIEKYRIAEHKINSYSEFLQDRLDLMLGKAADAKARLLDKATTIRPDAMAAAKSPDAAPATAT
jgi:hypothetical protein